MNASAIFGGKTGRHKAFLRRDQPPTGAVEGTGMKGEEGEEWRSGKAGFGLRPTRIPMPPSGLRATPFSISLESLEKTVFPFASRGTLEYRCSRNPAGLPFFHDRLFL
jgi:hypothetical protein